MTRLVQLLLATLCVLVTWPALARVQEDTTSPVTTTRPSHGRPQRSEDGRWGGAGRAQAEGRARNRVGIKVPGGIRARWERDSIGRPIRHEIWRGTQFQGAKQYIWDVNDRLTKVIDAMTGPVEYRHDALGNLAAATYADGKVDLRMPDAVGNLFRTPDRSDRKYGPAGQLLESRDARGVTTYDYDPEGNLTKKVEPDGSAWTYEWNGAAMLARVVRPNGHVVEFGYDALARRTFKKYRGKTTKWIWDGNVPLHEWVERDADAVDEDFARHGTEDDAVAVAEKQLKAMLSARPANGPPEQSASAASLAKASTEGTVDAPVTWVFEPESFAPLAKIVGGERFGIVVDHLGTPRAMFDGAGSEVWGADVDAYGDLRNLRGERAACPFRWPGQYEDEETGLCYNRWRYFDPHTCGFIEQDPIGLLAGLRTYSYPGDPNRRVDPSGLAPLSGVDFTGSPDLYPVAPGEKNIVQIPLQGTRGRDFTQANKEAGLPSTPKDYTWHHLNDFDPNTGMSTMQLVKRDAHEASFPHRGSADQFAKQFGVEYDTPAAVAKAEEQGWLRGRKPKNGCKG